MSLHNYVDDDNIDADCLTGVLGPLLGEVVKNMKDKRDGRLSAQQKLFIYSAVSSTTYYMEVHCQSVNLMG